MLKAIETVYNGYRFRSRLEARWAVFFDTLGIKYEYEKEGYDLDGVWYLPDFWLPELKIWVEIKGQEPTDEEIEKIRKLSELAGDDSGAYIISGQIPQSTEDVYFDGNTKILGHLRVIGKISLYKTICWQYCLLCNKPGLSLIASFPFTCNCYYKLVNFIRANQWEDKDIIQGLWERNTDNTDMNDKINQAYTAARQARFEHK